MALPELARVYAQQHSDDVDHILFLARLDPAWRAKNTHLTAAAVQARRSTPAPAAASRTAPAVRRYTGPLDVGAVRAQRAADEAARRPPAPPGGAIRFVAAGTWRWARVDSRLPQARSWEPLVMDLVACGPLRSLCVEQAATVPGAAGGHTRIHEGDGGTLLWASIAVDPAQCPGGRVDRIIRHELAHVADELAALRLSVSTTSWRRHFTDPHRSRQAEAFAQEAEEWVTTRTTGAELVDAARRHQAGRHG